MDDIANGLYHGKNPKIARLSTLVPVQQLYCGGLGQVDGATKVTES